MCYMLEVVDYYFKDIDKYYKVGDCVCVCVLKVCIEVWYERNFG